MTTRKQLADWIEKGYLHPQLIEDPIMTGTMRPNMQRLKGSSEEVDLTEDWSYWDPRFHEIGRSLPLYSLSANVLGMAILGRFGTPGRAWHIYFNQAIRRNQAKRISYDRDNHFAQEGKLLGISAYSAERLHSWYLNDPWPLGEVDPLPIEKIVRMLRDHDPDLFASDEL